MIAFYDEDVKNLVFDLNVGTEQFKFTIDKPSPTVERRIFVFYRPTEDGGLGERVFEAVSGLRLNTSKRITYAALRLLQRKYPALVSEEYVKAFDDSAQENRYYGGGSIQ